MGLFSSFSKMFSSGSSKKKAALQELYRSKIREYSTYRSWKDFWIYADSSDNNRIPEEKRPVILRLASKEELSTNDVVAVYVAKDLSAGWIFTIDSVYFYDEDAQQQIPYRKIKRAQPPQLGAIEKSIFDMELAFGPSYGYVHDKLCVLEIYLTDSDDCIFINGIKTSDKRINDLYAADVAGFLNVAARIS